jgi:hypothetical protein
MTKLLRLGVMAAALVGCASLSVAQGGSNRGETWRHNYGEGYYANGTVEAGPYVAPRHVPIQPDLPLTWEEKRQFEAK